MRTLAIAALVLVLAGCGSTTTPAPVDTSNLDGRASTVTYATTQTGVKYLVDGTGRALYLFMNDTGPSSTCSGACATQWPPLSGSVTAGMGLTGALTTSNRADGTTQAVYGGHPLYYYQQDSGPGQTKGEGVNGSGGLWYLVDPSGTAVTSLDGTPDPGQVGGY
jgi:predicted lipoprotein with Yx(FWY)xxD motif